VVRILDSVKQLGLRVGAVVRGGEGGEDDRELGSRTGRGAGGTMQLRGHHRAAGRWISADCGGAAPI
jgi:hypothetical protein